MRRASLKRIRIVGVCLVAIFALVAVVATGASAEEPPEVGRCLKLAGGKFKDGGCKTPSKPGEEKFEWYPAYIGGVLNETPSTPKLKYTFENKPETIIQLETVGGAVIKATGQSATGEWTGEKKNIAQNVVFKGVEFKGFKCKSTNPAATNEGEVKVKDLDGNIGIYKKGETKAKDKVANRLVPKDGSGIFTEFKCSIIPVVVRGAVLYPITANAMKCFPTPVGVKFTGSKGKQKPDRFVGGEKETLESSIEGGPFEASDQVLTLLQKCEEKLEVSTVN
jgi:hypothetical protein